MALTPCNDCGHPVSHNAQACPNCGNSLGKKGPRRLAFILIPSILLTTAAAVFAYYAWQQQLVEPETTVTKVAEATDAAPAEPTPATPQPGAPAEEKNKAPLPPAAPTAKAAEPITPSTSVTTTLTRWVYQKSEYLMGKGYDYQAFTKSTNTLSFKAPYTGTQRATLCLRTHPMYGKDLIVSVEKGQLLTAGSDTTKILVRFDDEEAVTYQATGSADKDSRYLFITDYHGFVSRMLKAKRVRVSMTVHQEGNPVFEFDVTGFSSDKYLGKEN